MFESHQVAAGGEFLFLLSHRVCQKGGCCRFNFFKSYNWIDSKAKIKFRGTSFMIGSSCWLTCFFRKNGFVAFFAGFEGWKVWWFSWCRMDWSVGPICLIGRCTIYMICWYVQLVVWRRWLVFLWLRFWDAVLWRRLWTCSTYHFMGSRRALAVSVQAEAVFLLIIKFPRHILSRAFIASWRFPQMVVIVPDSPPSSQKMLSRSTSLQQKHCVDCCPWKGTLLRGKQSSNHHFSEASCQISGAYHPGFLGAFTPHPTPPRRKSGVAVWSRCRHHVLWGWGWSFGWQQISWKKTMKKTLLLFQYVVDTCYI